TNMAIEAGAKNGIIGFDETTREFLESRAQRTYTPVESDPDAEYEKTFEFDAAAVPITLAKPMSPDHTASIDEVAGTRLDQVYLSNPVVAAASAVAGEIIHPKEVMGRELVAV